MKRTQRVALATLSLGWMILIGTVAFVTVSLHRDNPLSQINQPNVVAQAFVGAILYVWLLAVILVILVLSYLIFFVFPSLLTLPFVLPFAWRWRDPFKFLILRPFNRAQLTQELGQFLRAGFAPLGHCYTLSDRLVRVPLSIRVPIVQGQLSFFHFRLHKIRRPEHIDKLIRAMRHGVRRNMNWCMSRTKLFPVTCCDPGWQACVARLAAEVDIVVADLSSMTPNIAWELEFLRDAGALAKTVFVVEASQCAEAQTRISQMAAPFQQRPLLPYGPALASNGQVNNAVMDIVCTDPLPIATASPQ